MKITRERPLFRQASKYENINFPVWQSRAPVELVLLLGYSLGSRGGDSHMRQTGMLVFSLRGVNFGFWSRLGCSGQSANILSLGFREELEIYDNAFKNYF